MARKYLVPIDLTQQELQNARIQNLASAPTSPAPVAGQVYFNTTDSTLYFYSGTAWVAAKTNPYSYGSGESTTLGIGDSAADGTSTNLARADHKHAGPGFGNVASLTFGGAGKNGNATTVSRSDHEHPMPAHDASAHSAIKISDLAAPAMEVSFGSQRIKDLADPINAQNAATKNYVDTRKVTDLTAPTSAFSMNNQRITDVATPSNANDVATKEYVDAVAEGLHIHASCDAATTGSLATITGGSVTYNNGTNGVGATLTLSVALTTLDGYTLQNGDRILVKDESLSDYPKNGIYTWATGGTVLTRASDFNTATEIAGGDFTFVTNGSQYNNTGWVQTEAVATVGSDAVIFQQFSGAGTYTASNGVLLTGTNFTFNPDSTGGLQTGASGAAIKLKTNSGLGTDANGLSVGAGTGITVSGGNVSLTNTSVTVNGTSVSLGGSGTITANTPNALTLGTGLTGTSFNGSSAVTAAIDTSVVARKHSVAVGDGSNTSYTVTHNLGTRDVMVSVRETSSPYAKVEPDIAMTTTNTVTISFAVAPTSTQYTVTVIG